MDVRFRALQLEDLPAIRDWLAAPHVREWWGDPDEQYRLVSGDFDEPAMDQYVIALDGVPAGYLQCYALSAWNEGLGDHPEGTRGIDLFIAAAERIGRGYGGYLIRAFCDEMFRRGVPRMVTDPHPTNERAIRAYERAGFARERLIGTPDGTALLMMRHAGALP